MTRAVAQIMEMEAEIKALHTEFLPVEYCEPDSELWIALGEDDHYQLVDTTRKMMGVFDYAREYEQSPHGETLYGVSQYGAAIREIVIPAVETAMQKAPQLLDETNGNALMTGLRTLQELADQAVMEERNNGRPQTQTEFFAAKLEAMQSGSTFMANELERRATDSVRAR